MKATVTLKPEYVQNEVKRQQWVNYWSAESFTAEVETSVHHYNTWSIFFDGLPDGVCLRIAKACADNAGIDLHAATELLMLNGVAVGKKFVDVTPLADEAVRP